VYDLIDYKTLKLFFKYFLVVTIILGHLNIVLYAIFYLSGINVFGAVRDVTLAAYPQLQSICIEPQALGNHIVMAITILLFNYDDIFSSKSTTVYFLLILLLNLVLTLSSGAILLLLLILVAYIFSKNKSIVVAFVPLTAMALFVLYYNENPVITEIFNKFGMLLGGLTFLSDNLYLDTGQFFYSSAGARITFWQVALREFIDNPITGVGPERYGFFYELYNYGRQGEVPNQPPQNIFFGTLANLGIIGFLVILMLIIKPIIKSTYYFIFRNHLVDKEFKTTTLLVICALFLQLQAWNFTSYKFWFFIIVIDKFLKNSRRISRKEIPCLDAGGYNPSLANL
jgi:O-antigen ligase